MALRKTLKKTHQGYSGELIAENAYWRVTEVSGTKYALSVNVEALIDGHQVDSRTYRFAPDVAEGSANFIKQAYLHLKTLPEFADSIDC